MLFFIKVCQNDSYFTCTVYSLSVISHKKCNFITVSTHQIELVELEKHRIILHDAIYSIIFLTDFIDRWQIIFTFGIFLKISLPSHIMGLEHIFSWKRIFERELDNCQHDHNLYYLFIGRQSSILQSRRQDKKKLGLNQHR